MCGGAYLESWNPSTLKAEAVKSQLPGQHELKYKTLPQKKRIKKILSLVTTLMKLKDIMLTERPYTQIQVL
jgi:hypothetical protein